MFCACEKIKNKLYSENRVKRFVIIRELKIFYFANIVFLDNKQGDMFSISPYKL